MLADAALAEDEVSSRRIILVFACLVLLGWFVLPILATVKMIVSFARRLRGEVLMSDKKTLVARPAYAMPHVKVFCTARAVAPACPWAST